MHNERARAPPRRGKGARAVGMSRSPNNRDYDVLVIPARIVSIPMLCSNKPHRYANVSTSYHRYALRPTFKLIATQQFAASIDRFLVHELGFVDSRRS